MRTNAVRRPPFAGIFYWRLGELRTPGELIAKRRRSCRGPCWEEREEECSPTETDHGWDRPRSTRADRAAEPDCSGGAATRTKPGETLINRRCQRKRRKKREGEEACGPKGSKRVWELAKYNSSTFPHERTKMYVFFFFFFLVGSKLSASAARYQRKSCWNEAEAGRFRGLFHRKLVGEDRPGDPIHRYNFPAGRKTENSRMGESSGLGGGGNWAAVGSIRFESLRVYLRGKGVGMIVRRLNPPSGVWAHKLVSCPMWMGGGRDSCVLGEHVVAAKVSVGRRSAKHADCDLWLERAGGPRPWAAKPHSQGKEKGRRKKRRSRPRFTTLPPPFGGWGAKYFHSRAAGRPAKQDFHRPARMICATSVRQGQGKGTVGVTANSHRFSKFDRFEI